MSHLDDAQTIYNDDDQIVMSDEDMDVDDRGGVLADELEEEQADFLVRASGSAAARAEHAAAKEIIEERVRARNTVLPTDDAKVRQRLRALGEPITQFGERALERRERLREVLVKRQRVEGGGTPIEDEEDVRESDEDEQEEEFYTEGSADLVEARKEMARFSLKRAAKRIAGQNAQVSIPLQRIVQTRKKTFAPLRSFTNLGSQTCDTRPVSIVRFSPDGKLLGTGSWSGGVRLWHVPSARERNPLRGHTDKVGGLAWHPESTLSQSESVVNLATGAADGKVLLWSLNDEKPLSTLSGHAARVARVEFHPSGQYVASASFDGTWRLWDVARAKELQVQEGHSKEVYAVAFQDDGALIASGGLDAIGRVWDTRTGRTAMILNGHAREILSMDFSSNGYVVASASGDDTVKIWDLRQLKETYSIPAHKSSCADVRFFKSRTERNGLHSGSSVTDSSLVEKLNGEDDDGVALPRSSMFLATAGYDGYIKIWSADDWQILRSMHSDSKAMSVDISPDGDMLASGEWGRTFKLWGSL
jgi:U4/U6 small nuclear ribonucleoprotein PRP4